MGKPLIFVVDDEANIRTTIQAALEDHGFDVQCYDDPSAAIKASLSTVPELIITDLVMPQLDGLSLIQKIKSMNPEINVLMITAYATLESAIGAIRSGASDYLVKPFKIDDLLNAVQKSLSQKHLIPKSGSTDQIFQARYDLKNLIGITPEIKEVHALIEKVAKTNSTILIIGESGTGKEMVARAIHYRSKRRDGPFVSVNCAALPEQLLESELFGYEKGAFTGAFSTKVCLFELAEKGTFLLDEVGDMPVSLQVKLLRVLQERILKRLGGIRDIPVNFRLIAATAKNLPEEIKAGKFREELFYRLNVIPIFLPPLRERAADISLFVLHFVRLFSERCAIKKTIKINDDAMAIFKQHQWPGNIRELENVMERLVTLSEASIVSASDAKKAIETGRFSSDISQSIYKSSNLKETLEQFERDLINRVLAEENGNKNRTAQKLHLTRQALHYKLKKYDISV